MTGPKKDEFWSTKTARVVGDDVNLFVVMKELIRSQGWKIDGEPLPPSLAASVMKPINTGCFIVIDSVNCPAAESLRILFKNPQCRLTPAIVLISDSAKTDVLIYERIFRVATAFKPLTPNKFIPAFEALLDFWQQPPLGALRRLSVSIDTVERTTIKMILEKMIANPVCMPFALQTLLQMMLSDHQYQEAEAKLLETFKAFPQNPAIFALCSWFYLDARMPNQAVKFLLKLSSIAPNSNIFSFDLTAAYLACGQIEEATKYLKYWHLSHPGNLLVESYLARLLVTEGKSEKNEDFNVAKGIVRKVAEIWDAAETALERKKDATRQDKAS